MKEKKIYKSTYYIYVKTTFFIAFIALFISPIIESRQFNIRRTLIIIIIALLYLLTKKRISKIVIDHKTKVIKLEVSHYLFLRHDSYSHSFQDVKIKEFERYFSGTTFAKIIEISLENKVSYEINTLVDGWSKKTLNEIKKDIENYKKH